MKKIRKAKHADLPSITALLDSSDLPTEGVEAHLAHFFVAVADGEIIGTGGLKTATEQVCSALLRYLQNAGIRASASNFINE